jgi:hypothetical protein
MTVFISERCNTFTSYRVLRDSSSEFDPGFAQNPIGVTKSQLLK